ncbi:flagellar basal-body MS-ring/collar protein FliF [Gluconobacter morbifer]|uniref:Flagellar M-ring protein n=1 Tax=Gluconobacter morbifer G707 TaxID=1088869 RepID=G6XLQ8_9PROT|nr:flagellar basal-body MS-ring/collar protein FliF [Gluconobacter morbifer]EHH67313.1 flagellar MS-ring protein [Gluconobacter morbifer G707]
MKVFLENLKQLGLPRLAALGGVAVAMVVLLGVLVMHSVNATNGLLYRDLDPREAGEIVEALSKSHIDYRLEGDGTTIMVAESEVARARLLLARNGLPSGGSVGYEIFDKSNSFTATQFEQTINETRALEGELERSIRLIHGVRNSRVHLVLRHRELFSTDEQNAQASVLLSMENGRRLNDESISAVVNLVAAAVPGLDIHNISLIDNHGHVLLKEGTNNINGPQTDEERRLVLEQRLARAVEDMLASSVGTGHIRVEANVAMNNDRVRETQEMYNPDQQVLRSQKSKNQKSVNTQSISNTTVSNNLPNANAGQPQSGNQNSQQEQVDNYEIGKTVRTLVQDQPRISKISMAVMVDGISSTDKQGHLIWQPRSQEELARLTALTKSAIGFDQQRGDIVTAVSMKFADFDVNSVEKDKGVINSLLSKSDSMEILKFVLFVCCLLMVLFFVVRPLLAPVGEAGLRNMLENEDSDKKELLSPKILALANEQNSGALISPNNEEEKDLGRQDTVSVNGVQGRVKVSSVQKIIDLVENHPAESIALIRGWLLPQQGRQ